MKSKFIEKLTNIKNLVRDTIQQFESVGEEDEQKINQGIEAFKSKLVEQIDLGISQLIKNKEKSSSSQVDDDRISRLEKTYELTIKRIIENFLQKEHFINNQLEFYKQIVQCTIGYTKYGIQNTYFLEEPYKKLPKIDVKQYQSADGSKIFYDFPSLKVEYNSKLSNKVKSNNCRKPAINSGRTVILLDKTDYNSSEIFTLETITHSHPEFIDFLDHPKNSEIDRKDIDFSKGIFNIQNLQQIENNSKYYTQYSDKFTSKISKPSIFSDIKKSIISPKLIFKSNILDEEENKKLFISCISNNVEKILEQPSNVEEEIIVKSKYIFLTQENGFGTNYHIHYSLFNENTLNANLNSEQNIIDSLIYQDQRNFQLKIQTKRNINEIMEKIERKLQKKENILQIIGSLFEIE